MRLPPSDPFWARYKRGPACEICRKALLPEHDLVRYSTNPPTWYWVHAECVPWFQKPAVPKGWKVQ